MGGIEFLTRVARTRRTGTRSWVTAIAFFLSALLVRIGLWQMLSPASFWPFFPAVVAATLYCGWREGAAVLGLSVVAGSILLLTPHSILLSADLAVILQIFGFSAVGAGFVVVIEGLVQAVHQLDSAARTKDEMFRELQHRVANNLQIVAATLEKEKRRITDAAARETFNAVLARVRSMAHLHQRLYCAAAYEEGVEPVLRDVLTTTFGDLPVEVRINICRVQLSVAQMTAIALLVNEAAINSAKHVFRAGKGGRFEVSLAELERSRLKLLVRDDGPGMPAHLKATDGSSRYGLTVMRGLATQLGGALEMPEGTGAILSVIFSCAQERPKSATLVKPVGPETTQVG